MLDSNRLAFAVLVLLLTASLTLLALMWPMQSEAAQLTLTWTDNSTTEDGLAIERATGQTGTFVQVTTVGPGITSYADSGLNAGTTYCYRVRAFNAAGTSSYSNQACGTAGATPTTTQIPASPPTTAPPPPSAAANPGAVNNLAVASLASTSATLAWTQVDDGTGKPALYDVRFNTPAISWGSAPSVSAGTCSSGQLAGTIGAKVTCTVEGLVAGTPYQFELVPYRGTLNVNAVFGPLSNIASGTTTAAAPRPATPPASTPAPPPTASTPTAPPPTVNTPATPPPSTGALLFSEDFESGDLSKWQDGANPAIHKVITDPSLAHSGSRVLEMDYTAGAGGGYLNTWFMPGVDEAYADYWVKFPTGWQGTTKLIGLYANRIDNQWSGLGQAGVCPNGTDYAVAMVVTENNSGVSNPDPGTTRFYTYYPDMAREPDGVTCWGRYGPASSPLSPYTGSPLGLSQGVWHNVRHYVHLNTPGSANGEQKLWIDGTLKAHWTNIRFRDTTDLRLNMFQLTGSGAAPITEKLYIDDIVVRAGNPDTASAPPPPAPTPPPVTATTPAPPTSTPPVIATPAPPTTTAPPSPTVTPTPSDPSLGSLPSPTNLTARVRRHWVALRWVDNSSGELGFVIERATDTTPFSQIGSVGPGQTSYVEQLNNGGRYRYRVRALGLGGQLSESSNMVDVTIR